MAGGNDHRSAMLSMIDMLEGRSEVGADVCRWFEASSALADH